MKQYTHNAFSTESASFLIATRQKELNDQCWSREKSSLLAEKEDITLIGAHWAVILYLRKQYLDEGLPRHARNLANELTTHYLPRGGNKYLRKLFPGGPITQGSRFACLRTPADATDASYGFCY